MHPRDSLDPTQPRIIGRWVWVALWIVVIAASAAWWWLMPGGFPLRHPRFWVHQALPPLAVGVAALGVAALVRRWAALARVSTLGLTIALLAATITGAALFPLSLRGELVAGAAASVLLGWMWIATWGRRQLLTRGAAIAATAAVIIGAGVGWSQRAPLADTRPLGEPAPAVSGAVMAPSALRSGPRATVFPDEAVVRIDAGVSLEIAPLLRFVSTSPDRCWTLFAPSDAHTPAPWRLTRVQVTGETEVGCLYDAERRLWVRELVDAVEIDASTTLAAPVYSHLNSFTRMSIHGHRRLSLEFAAAPGRPIEVLPSDYPVGRPLRFAYVDDGDILRVMTATSGEKGPFTELAAGPLADGAPLVIVLRDEGVPVWRVTMFDWASQRGRSLSPTAGWGVPVAALEFARLGELPGSQAELWISLASTSVGRGFDSVGHAAGTYRNRMRIEPLGAGAASPRP